MPERLLILGGGVVGVELAQAWSSLGASVALVEAVDRLIAAEEPFASEQVARALEAAGVEVRTGVKAVGASRGEGGQVSLRSTAATSCAATSSWSRSAAGRARPSSGWRPSGSRRTAISRSTTACGSAGSDWLYAIGDVNGRSLLTHMGKYQAWICIENDAGRDLEATADKHGSPRVVFTEPQVAAVGLTLEKALDRGLERSGRRRRDRGERRGELRRAQRARHVAAGVDERRGVVIGATFVGPEIAESLHAATIAVAGEVPIERLAPRGAGVPDPQRALAVPAAEAYGALSSAR